MDANPNCIASQIQDKLTAEPRTATSRVSNKKYRARKDSDSHAFSSCNDTQGSTTGSSAVQKRGPHLSKRPNQSNTKMSICVPSSAPKEKTENPSNGSYSSRLSAGPHPTLKTPEREVQGAEQAQGLSPTPTPLQVGAVVECAPQDGSNVPACASLPPLDFQALSKMPPKDMSKRSLKGSGKSRKNISVKNAGVGRHAAHELPLSSRTAGSTAALRGTASGVDQVETTLSRRGENSGLTQSGPILTEEWARSIINPEDEYLLYQRDAVVSTTQAGRNKKSSGSHLSSSYTLNIRQLLEEKARRKQSIDMLSERRRKLREAQSHEPSPLTSGRWAASSRQSDKFKKQLSTVTDLYSRSSVSHPEYVSGRVFPLSRDRSTTVERGSGPSAVNSAETRLSLGDAARASAKGLYTGLETGCFDSAEVNSPRISLGSQALSRRGFSSERGLPSNAALSFRATPAAIEADEAAAIKVIQANTKHIQERRTLLLFQRPAYQFFLGALKKGGEHKGRYPGSRTTSDSSVLSPYEAADTAGLDGSTAVQWDPAGVQNSHLSSSSSQPQGPQWRDSHGEILENVKPGPENAAAMSAPWPVMNLFSSLGAKETEAGAVTRQNVTEVIPHPEGFQNEARYLTFEDDANDAQLLMDPYFCLISEEKFERLLIEDLESNARRQLQKAFALGPELDLTMPSLRVYVESGDGDNEENVSLLLGSLSRVSAERVNYDKRIIVEKEEALHLEEPPLVPLSSTSASVEAQGALCGEHLQHDSVTTSDSTSLTPGVSAAEYGTILSGNDCPDRLAEKVDVPSKGTVSDPLLRDSETSLLIPRVVCKGTDLPGSIAALKAHGGPCMGSKKMSSRSVGFVEERSPIKDSLSAATLALEKGEVPVPRPVPIAPSTQECRAELAPVEVEIARSEPSSSPSQDTNEVKMAEMVVEPPCAPLGPYATELNDFCVAFWQHIQQCRNEHADMPVGPATDTRLPLQLNVTFLRELRKSIGLNESAVPALVGPSEEEKGHAQIAPSEVNNAVGLNAEKEVSMASTKENTPCPAQEEGLLSSLEDGSYDCHNIQYVLDLFECAWRCDGMFGITFPTLPDAFFDVAKGGGASKAFPRSEVFMSFGGGKPTAVSSKIKSHTMHGEKQRQLTPCMRALELSFSNQVHAKQTQEVKGTNTKIFKGINKKRKL